MFKKKIKYKLYFRNVNETLMFESRIDCIKPWQERCTTIMSYVGLDYL